MMIRFQIIPQIEKMYLLTLFTLKYYKIFLNSNNVGYLNLLILKIMINTVFSAVFYYLYILIILLPISLESFENGG